MLISIATRDGNYTADPSLPKIDTPTFETFQITDTKLYVPVVTLSTKNDKKLLEQLKSGFKRTVKWNKYRSQMTVQNNNNNLNYLIDPTDPKSTDCLFCRLQEMLKGIVEILFHTIMYQTLK